jgi:hypothetical protein
MTKVNHAYWTTKIGCERFKHLVTLSLIKQEELGGNPWDRKVMNGS